MEAQGAACMAPLAVVVPHTRRSSPAATAHGLLWWLYQADVQRLHSDSR